MSNIMEIMKARHSVRQYTDKKIESAKRSELKLLTEECNKKGNLTIQIIYDEPKCFDSMLAHYGKFKGVSNYIALVGGNDQELEEKCGYYGEKLVLKAQELGLNTCWVALTYGKRKCKAAINKEEKLLCVIALGYGVTQGEFHKSKELEELCDYEKPMPNWFRDGMEAARLAPTATNQQKFKISWNGEKVDAKEGKGFYTKLDLGIVKYHFEVVSNHKVGSL